MEEVWKDIKGYEGYYQVSNTGQVKSLRNNIILKQTYCKGNYLQVKLSINGIQKHMQIHRLVASVFIENTSNKPQVNHIDCNKENNNINNLEWVTAAENTKHAIEKGIFHFYDNKRKIFQLNVDGNVLNEYNSMKEAAVSCNTSYNNIYFACKHPNNKAKGFKWRYADIKEY